MQMCVFINSLCMFLLLARLCAICVLVFVFRRWQVLSPRVFLHKMGLLTWLVFSFFVICYSTMEDEFIAFLLFYFHLLLMKNASNVIVGPVKCQQCQHHGRKNEGMPTRRQTATAASWQAKPKPDLSQRANKPRSAEHPSSSKTFFLYLQTCPLA